MPQAKAGTVLVGFASWYSNLYEDSGVKRHAIPYVGRSGRARTSWRFQLAAWRAP